MKAPCRLEQALAGLRRRKTADLRALDFLLACGSPLLKSRDAAVQLLGSYGAAGRPAVPALVEAKRGAKKELRDAIDAALAAITGE